MIPYSRHRSPVALPEKLRSSLAGGTAILLLGWMLHALPQTPHPMLMLGSIAASAVLLFAAPHSPMAQPWNLVMGHLLSALAGWGCGLAIGDPVLAGAAAVGCAILLMHLLDALHPPGAATALTLVLSATQFHAMGEIWMLAIVAANAGASLLLALAINNLLPGRRYPARAVSPPPKPDVSAENLQWALQRMDGVIDVSKDDLLEIYRLAQQHVEQQYQQALQKK